MATRTAPAPTNTPDLPPDGNDFPLSNGAAYDDDIGESITDRVRSVVAEDVGGQARISVWRMNPRSSKFEYCEDISPAEFENNILDVLRSKWGAGTYEARIYGSRDGKNTGYLRRPRFVIAALSPTANMGGGSQSSTDDRFLALIAAMNDNTQRTLDAIQALAQNRTDPKTDLAQTIALMGSLRDVFAPPANAAPAQSPMQMLKEAFEVVTMARESSQAEAPPTKEESLISLAGPLLETIKAALPQRGATSPVVGAVAGGMLPPVTLPASVAGADTQQQHAMPPPVTIPALNAPDPGQPIEPNPADPSSVTRPLTVDEPAFHPADHFPQTHETAMNSEQALILKGHADKLLAMAADGIPAADAGAYIADHFPEEVLPYLSLTTWWDLLALRLPRDLVQRMTPHRTWLEEAVREANRLLDEAGDEPA